MSQRHDWRSTLSPAPMTLGDFNDSTGVSFDAGRNRHDAERHALSEIRRESLDPYNRLHSIAEDIEFVNVVHRTYPSLPLIPNLRCGAWYTNPPTTYSEAAYFKSTDGHFGSWSFNLRRPNLHLLSLIPNFYGMIIVDSTRAGKRIPDSLSKTIPIWCAVINRAQKRREGLLTEWDTELYTPPSLVSKQEHSQIEKRLDNWATSLLTSSYDVPELLKPLRPLWITPATSVFPSISSDLNFYPIICVSASKLIPEGMERRQNGFAYVQGSGDDHESWSLGLTPDVFWRRKDELLWTPRSELLELISFLVVNSTSVINVERTRSPTPITRISGLLSLSAIIDLPSPFRAHVVGDNSQTLSSPCLIITAASRSRPMASELKGSPNTPLILELMTLPGKKGEAHFKRTILPHSLQFIKSHLYAGKPICIACDTGKDLSVGIAVAALQMFFDEEGKLIARSQVGELAGVNKSSIRTRLQWVIASRPQANPLRATLKRINEFFLSSPTATSESKSN